MIVSDHNNSCWGTNVPGHRRVWAQSCLGTIVSGHNRVWAQSCLGTIVSGHNRVWAQSCLGTVVWAQSCGPKQLPIVNLQFTLHNCQSLFPYSS